MKFLRPYALPLFSVLLFLPGLQSCRKYSPVFLDSSWMDEIHDSTLVCRMAIPGAHDAATGTLETAVIRNYAKTQALSVGELWDAGVRAFDLRPALVDGQLGIFHDKYYAGTTLQDALQTIVEKLGKQASDFAIVLPLR